MANVPEADLKMLLQYLSTQWMTPAVKEAYDRVAVAVKFWAP